MTGASRGYAFVEFEAEREMRRAYMVLPFVTLLFTFFILNKRMKLNDMKF